MASYPKFEHFQHMNPAWVLLIAAPTVKEINMTSQMLREIEQQPEAVHATTTKLISRRAEVAALFGRRRHVLFAARGSSDHAASYGRYLLETQAGVQAALAAPSVFTRYGTSMDLSDTLLVTVSQSGRTQELCEVQDAARGCGAATLAISNSAESPLAQAADLALVTQAGQEKAVPATKTYLTQLLAMFILASSLSEPLRAQDGLLSRLPELLEEELGERHAAAKAAHLVAGSSASTVVTGRGILLGTALEGGLKFEETCGRPVRTYSWADLRHGPIAGIGAGTVVLLVAPSAGRFAADAADVGHQLRNVGAEVIAVGGGRELARVASLAVGTPSVPETLAPLVSILPIQLMVEATAQLLDLPVDAPPGLNKVTQTDTTN